VEAVKKEAGLLGQGCLCANVRSRSTCKWRAVAESWGSIGRGSCSAGRENYELGCGGRWSSAGAVSATS